MARTDVRRTPVLAQLVESGYPAARNALRQRLQILLRSLGQEMTESEPAHHLLSATSSVLEASGADEWWLAQAVVTGQLPDPASVARTVRASHLEGPLEALSRALADSGRLRDERWTPVEVVSGQVLVDVHHTTAYLFGSGIQRVVREAALRWRRDHDPLFVGWSEQFRSLVRIGLGEEGRDKKEGGDKEEGGGEEGHGNEEGASLVPWRSVLVVPELAGEPGRAERLQAIAEHAQCTTGLVGHDCVPLTAAETVRGDMSRAFALYLGAAAHFDRVAAVSETSAGEYRGWKTMLGGAGLRGPEVVAIPNATEVRVPADELLEEAKRLLGLGRYPIVLAVGSHEPRKNHGALLHAAELLWQEGVEFTLALIGSNSWSTEVFDHHIARLAARNRPVQVVSGLSDDLLWAAYRVAYCTVFPSIHEGFGLPVAESLASGTPVITSDFGAMREVASRGGALLVDPHDDHQLAAALRRLLADPELRGRLAAEALACPTRTWDAYAAETWSYLVDGVRPVEGVRPEA